MIRVLALTLLLSGCTLAPGCFVGFSLIPPAPFVVCGLDAAPSEKAD